MSSKSMLATTSLRSASPSRNPASVQSLFRRPLEAAETRTHHQVYEHYQVERVLADRLGHALPTERSTLYRQVYDELFRRVPHHPQLTRKRTADDLRVDLQRQFSFLGRHVAPDDTLVEVGAGDCALSRRMAGRCRRVIAVDVSEDIATHVDWPANCEFRPAEGICLPVDTASVDVVYSNQLMEHLHPEDAVQQLKEIARVLRPGGRYVCVTPNRIAGPWDISMYFDETARGLHLREYSVGELDRCLADAGFARMAVYAGGRGVFFRVPAAVVQWAERLLLGLPYRMRSGITRWFPVRALLGLRVVARKPLH
jgi:SAM-dependent methyltransferase